MEIRKAVSALAVGMDVHDEFIPAETFGACIDALPEVCVEVLLRGDEGVLVARRTIEPAKGEWFWPGGRLYKGERLPDAARRIAREELGVTVDVEERFGVYSHFWDVAAVEGADSRHTVNVVYLVRRADPDEAIELDDQHDAYRFVGGESAGEAAGGTLHEYVRRYLADLGLATG